MLRLRTLIQTRRTENGNMSNEPTDKDGAVDPADADAATTTEQETGFGAHDGGEGEGKSPSDATVSEDDGVFGVPEDNGIEGDDAADTEITSDFDEDEDPAFASPDEQPFVFADEELTDEDNDAANDSGVGTFDFAQAEIVQSSIQFDDPRGQVPNPKAVFDAFNPVIQERLSQFEPAITQAKQNLDSAKAANTKKARKAAFAQQEREIREEREGPINELVTEISTLEFRLKTAKSRLSSLEKLEKSGKDALTKELTTLRKLHKEIQDEIADGAVDADDLSHLDIDGDGDVDAQDASRIQVKIARIEEALQSGEAPDESALGEIRKQASALRVKIENVSQNVSAKQAELATAQAALKTEIETKTAQLGEQLSQNVVTAEGQLADVVDQANQAQRAIEAERDQMVARETQDLETYSSLTSQVQSVLNSVAKDFSEASDVDAIINSEALQSLRDFEQQRRDYIQTSAPNLAA